jgi:gluconate 2-dehydrogenase gamma chain
MMTSTSAQGAAGPETEGLMFFNAIEARTLDAVTSRIIPSEPDGMGAHEAAVVTYIDHAVAGYFRDLQGIYRIGLQRLNDDCLQVYGSLFPDLSVSDQNAILVQLDAGVPDGSLAGEAGAIVAANATETILSRFFAIVREHTIQGMFCDPIYGGNRGFTGWKLIGFPGAQWGYSPEQMREGFDATTIPILSVADLQRLKAGISHD